MVNQDSLDAVQSASYTGPFIRPLYDSFCFYQLPQTIESLLCGDPARGLPESVLPPARAGCDSVVLFFIDALGWRFFAQYADRYPFLQHFARNGVISKLTSQFPSTTSAHVTTIHTGLAPAQSGVYEWFQYEPKLNALVTPLMFNLAGDQTRDTLTTDGLTAADIFPPHTIYETLVAHGVKAHAFQSNVFAHSVPSKHLLSHAETVPFKTWPEALVHLAQRLERQDQPTYYVLYFPNIDSLCHEFGPNSAEVDAELDSFFVTMERLLLGRLLGKYPRTLVMVTADHGMSEINPATTVYLNQRDDLRDLRPMLSVNRTGAPIIPAGSSRDLFLHVKPDALDDARELLQQALADSALVVPTARLIADGLFGPQAMNPSARFSSRVGNLALLPYPGASVYWYERGRFEQRFLGQHGGLTRDEMEIPLLTCYL